MKVYIIVGVILLVWALVGTVGLQAGNVRERRKQRNG